MKMLWLKWVNGILKDKLDPNQTFNKVVYVKRISNSIFLSAKRIKLKWRIYTL